MTSKSTFSSKAKFFLSQVSALRDARLVNVDRDGVTDVVVGVADAFVARASRRRAGVDCVIWKRNVVKNIKLKVYKTTLTSHVMLTPRNDAGQRELNVFLMAGVAAKDKCKRPLKLTKCNDCKCMMTGLLTVNLTGTLKMHG